MDRGGAKAGVHAKYDTNGTRLGRQVPIIEVRKSTVGLA